MMTWEELKAAIDAEPRMSEKIRLQQEWNEQHEAEALEENTDES